MLVSYSSHIGRETRSRVNTSDVGVMSESISDGTFVAFVDTIKTCDTTGIIDLMLPAVYACRLAVSRT